MNTLMKKTNGNMPGTNFNGLVEKLFQHNVNRLFDDGYWGFTNVNHNVSVPVNIKETDKSYEVDLVAPGLKKEDFKINVSGELLTVAFEHQETHNEDTKNGGWVRNEYHKRSFTRSFNLDDTIDATRISARYADGILQLSLPKKEGAQALSRTIEIN